jgi:hypothetical protein
MKGLGMFKIEKNVAIPPLPQGREAKYPWEQMEPAKKVKRGGKEELVGDAFTIPGGKASVVSSANKRYKEQGKKFTARQMQEGGKPVLKVWRIQ